MFESISLPCRRSSEAHTTTGKDDETNMAISMSREAFLTGNPFIGMNESVPGLMERRGLWWFVEHTHVVDSELRARTYWDNSFLHSSTLRHLLATNLRYLAEDGLA